VINIDFQFFETLKLALIPHILSIPNRKALKKFGIVNLI